MQGIISFPAQVNGQSQTLTYGRLNTPGRAAQLAAQLFASNAGAKDAFLAQFTVWEEQSGEVLFVNVRSVAVLIRRDLPRDLRAAACTATFADPEAVQIAQAILNERRTVYTDI